MLHFDLHDCVFLHFFALNLMHEFVLLLSCFYLLAQVLELLIDVVDGLGGPFVGLGWDHAIFYLLDFD